MHRRGTQFVNGWFVRMPLLAAVLALAFASANLAIIADCARVPAPLCESIDVDDIEDVSSAPVPSFPAAFPQLLRDTASPLIAVPACFAAIFQPPEAA